MLADRCVIFSKYHRIAGVGTPARVLCDRDLLLSVNLIHEHVHAHGGVTHACDHATGHHDESEHR